jgi:diphthamide synthase (EF-2-diphthine--ammonia ligase)
VEPGRRADVQLAARMAAKRQVLEALTRGELQAVAEQFELEVEDRRVKDQLVDAAAASRNVDLGEVLAAYPRDRLKALCRELGLSASRTSCGRRPTCSATTWTRPSTSTSCSG